MYNPLILHFRNSSGFPLHTYSNIFPDKKGRGHFRPTVRRVASVSSTVRVQRPLTLICILRANDEPRRDLLSRSTNYLVIKFFHPLLLSRGTDGRVHVVQTFYNDFSILRWLREKVIRRPV